MTFSNSASWSFYPLHSSCALSTKWPCLPSHLLSFIRSIIITSYHLPLHIFRPHNSPSKRRVRHRWTLTQIPKERLSAQNLSHLSLSCFLFRRTPHPTWSIASGVVGCQIYQRIFPPRSWLYHDQRPSRPSFFSVGTLWSHEPRLVGNRKAQISWN